jgi:hypothetical protein
MAYNTERITFQSTTEATADLKLAQLKSLRERLVAEELIRLKPFVYLENQNSRTREAFREFIKDGNTWRIGKSYVKKDVQGVVVVLPKSTEDSDQVPVCLLSYTQSAKMDTISEDKDNDTGDARLSFVLLPSSSLEDVLTTSGYPFRGLARNEYERRADMDILLLPRGDLMQRGEPFTKDASVTTLFADPIIRKFNTSVYAEAAGKALKDVVETEHYLSIVEMAGMNHTLNPHLNKPIKGIEPSDTSALGLILEARSDGGFIA